MITDTFLQVFLGFVQSNTRVVDIGAGDGRYAKCFAERGAKVTAVEHALWQDRHVARGVDWVHMDLRLWLSYEADTRYDAYFMSNVLQFLDAAYVAETLMPSLVRRTGRGGIVGIRTFFADPLPAFPSGFRSYWSLESLQDLFLSDSGRVIFMRRHERDGVDFQGAPRRFALSEMIWQRG